MFSFDENDKDGTKPLGTKFDHDLFVEENDKVENIYRIKRIKYGLEEKWKIFINDELVYTILGSKLKKKELNYLRTVEGNNFLINYLKAGNELKLKSIQKSISLMIIKEICGNLMSY